MNTKWRREAHESLTVSHVLLVHTRRVRRGGWLPLLLFGIVTLAALPLYEIQANCGQPGVVCTGRQSVRVLDVFATLSPLQSQGRWLSVYWVVAVLFVYAATALYYCRRGVITGVRGRTWPTVGTGAILLAVVLMAAGWLSGWPVTVGNNGTEPLAIVAISLLVLATSERSVLMTLFVAGYFVLVCISLFYNDVNAFERVGLGGPFRGSGVLFPNLIVPGVYLVLGGAPVLQLDAAERPRRRRYT